MPIKVVRDEQLVFLQVVSGFHRDGSIGQVVFVCQKANLWGVVVSHQKLARKPGHLFKKPGMVNVVQGVQAFSGNGVRWVYEEVGTGVVLVLGDDLERIGCDKLNFVLDQSNCQNSVFQRFGVPTRVDTFPGLANFDHPGAFGKDATVKDSVF